MTNGMVPPGYTARLVDEIEPAALSAGVSVLEQSFAEGAMLCLQMELSSRPDNIDEIASELSRCLKQAGVQSWLIEPAYADPVYPRIWACWVKGETVAPALAGFLGTTLGKLLIGLLIGIFAFLLIPGLAELIETVVMMMFMFMMMYLMTSVMSTMYPALKPVKEREAELIERARRGIPEAVERVKSLAERGVGWARRVWEEVKPKE